VYRGRIFSARRRRSVVPPPISAACGLDAFPRMRNGKAILGGPQTARAWEEPE
jgi:hypothetical protein